MRKIKLIYNPVSGDAGFKHTLDQVIDHFQVRKLQIIPHRSAGKEDIRGVVGRMGQEGYSGLAIAGGDGTVHEVINAMAAEGIQVPVCVIPAGTANDFAAHFAIPREIEKISAMIAAGYHRTVDLGQANERYFANVAGAGLLADIAYTVDIHFKNRLGKLAYYLKGVEKLPDFRSVPLRIESEEVTVNEELFLFLVFNGSSAGGISRIVPARMDDGLLDVIAIRKCSLPHLFTLMLKIIRGEHLNDSRILYFRTKEVAVHSLTSLTSDLDGEKGPELPLHIKIHPGALSLFVER